MAFPRLTLRSRIFFSERCRRFADFISHLFEFDRHRAGTKLPKSLNLRFNVRCILRQLGDKNCDLPCHQTTDQEHCQASGSDTKHDSWHPSNASLLKFINDRIQQKREQDRQCYGNQYRPSPLQSNHNDQANDRSGQDNNCILPRRNDACFCHKNYLSCGLENRPTGSFTRIPNSNATPVLRGTG